jgi:hypothetical protein
MDVGRFDPELTDTILEFVSDGESVLFSSGVADDAGRGASPDLWRFDVATRDPPEVLWRNPERDHGIAKIVGDLGMVAFVDMPLDGQRAWNLWLIPRHEEGEPPILLDSHPGDADVPGFVPSFSIQESTIVWTAFDRGPDGPVSQLLLAREPDWEPKLLLERSSERAELWFPSLYGSSVAFCEVVYASDRQTDTRTIYLLDLASPDAKPRKLSHSGLATMPVLLDDRVIWKETDPGFNMLTWGRLWVHDIGGPLPTQLDTAPLDYVNHPSAGSRFVAWRANDSFTFAVYDLLEERTRVIEQHTAQDPIDILRPHIAGDLLVWMRVEDAERPGGLAELRYAIMPPLRALR